MKKIISLALVAMMIFSMTACSKEVKEEVKDEVGKVEENVEGAAKEAEAYLKEKTEKLGTLETEISDKAKELEHGLEVDAAATEYFVTGVKDEVIVKIESLEQEAKAITVDNPELKKLHEGLIEMYGKLKDSYTKLATAVEEKSEEGVQAAKAEIEKIKGDIAGVEEKVKEML